MNIEGLTPEEAQKAAEDSGMFKFDDGTPMTLPEALASSLNAVIDVTAGHYNLPHATVFVEVLGLVCAHADRLQGMAELTGDLDGVVLQ